MERKLLDLNIGQVLKDEPMANHTSFRIGGPAAYLCLPDSVENTAKLIKFLNEIGQPYYIIGNGSNLLVDDEGMDCLVIKIASNLAKFHLDGQRLYAQAGASLTEVSKFAIKNSLEGMEAISGIPGNIGGAVAMNAGAYGSEIKDVLTSIRAVDKKGQVLDIKADDLDLAYRSSRVLKEGLVVLEAVFDLKKGDLDEIRARYEDFRDRRISKQPLDKPSAGSTFKRPEGHYASKLIEDAGLKGYRYKNAMVSDKHSGFIIAEYPSTCEEVLKVIGHVQEVVEEKFSVKLEPEVRILGGSHGLS